jgi:hypothetical protein
VAQRAVGAAKGEDFAVADFCKPGAVYALLTVV